jgi:hypothetical protein
MYSGMTDCCICCMRLTGCRGCFAMAVVDTEEGVYLERIKGVPFFAKICPGYHKSAPRQASKLVTVISR